jgi:hypothetical protein
LLLTISLLLVEVVVADLQLVEVAVAVLVGY